MAYQKGDRVGVMSHSDGDTMYIFGYGTYQGNQVPDPQLGVKSFGLPMEVPNPCIQLDNGKLVYGCECWWGNEEAIRNRVALFRKVVELDIERERSNHERDQLHSQAGA